jgi:energy-coupling factor transporter ATP-binding protein EcfA2
MKSLTLKLENCYGIPSLEHTFDFTKSNTNLVYAPNGVMKTSLAKTFLKISSGSLPEEKLYNKTPSFEIRIDGVDIESEDILVIEPFDPSYESKNISTLLVNADKKSKYDQIYKEILEAKRKLIIVLNKLSKIPKDDIERTLNRDLGCGNIFEAIQLLQSLDIGDINYSKINYKSLFDPKVVALLQDKDVQTGISEYIARYNELIENSSIFKKNGFNPIKANSVSSSLKKEKFFEAEHKVLLNGKDEPVSDHKNLEEILEKEKENILGDGNLKEISQKIISGVASVKIFQEILEKFPEISTELADLGKLKQLMWGSYFQANKDMFVELYTLFENNKSELANIEKEAILEETLWFEAQEIFKERFHVPFTMEIENYSNAILGTKAPNIIFSFENENGDKVRFNHGQLDSMDFLSVGERRAMYILYVIFEFKARIASEKRTIIIIDDIADSFDYKNKYAIIEYLKELSEENLFCILVLTHNFDFYRTFQNRVLNTAKWHNSFIAHKLENSIKLLKGGSKDVSSPFELWKRNYNNNEAMLISMIPFVRNLIEYKDGTSSNGYKTLTSMLHVKPDTYTLKLSDLENLINEVILTSGSESTYEQEKLVINQIYQTADDLCLTASDDEICLEKKVALSIATRLKAEEFMWDYVSDKSSFKGQQTGLLYDRLVTENMPLSGNFIQVKKVKYQNLIFNFFYF